MTFGFVGDPGSFLSQQQGDWQLRELLLTVRLTALSIANGPIGEGATLTDNFKHCFS